MNDSRARPPTSARSKLDDARRKCDRVVKFHRRGSSQHATELFDDAHGNPAWHGEHIAALAQSQADSIEGQVAIVEEQDRARSRHRALARTVLVVGAVELVRIVAALVHCVWSLT